MVSMAESVAIPSSRKTHNPYHLQKKKKDLNYSDMAAAQQLMQLSDEENNNSNSNSKVEMTDDEEVFDQRLLTMMKTNNNVHVNIMEEIFGKDDVVFCRAKKRRYRSLADIYMATTKKVFTSPSSTQN